MTEETATGSPVPQVADRLTWQAKLDELRVKEKAHTRAGDTLAAERRRLPMVEVDPKTPLIGGDGPVPLIDVFDGRSQLIAYFLMWHTGGPPRSSAKAAPSPRPTSASCPICTRGTWATQPFVRGRTRRARAIATSWAGRFPGTRCRGVRRPVGRRPALRHPRLLSPGRRPGLRDLLDHRPRQRGDGAVVRAAGPDGLRPAGALGGLAGAGRSAGSQGGQFRLDGRPTAQWSRIRAGRNDDLGATSGGHSGRHGH